MLRWLSEGGIATINEKYTASVRRKYNRNALMYDAMDKMVAEDRRRLVIGQAAGRVLEIGVGTGKNLPLYDPAITAEVVGVDLSPGMLAKARTKPCRVPLTLLEMDAQRLTFPDASFDTVISTCVFCTVPDPVQGLKEARRVVKPGGRLIMLEHIRLDRPVVGALMDLVDPLVVWIIGTHINRRTVENVKAAGFTLEKVEVAGSAVMRLIEARP